MIDAELLRRLRNDLPMPVLIAALGRDGPPSMMSEGYYRFLCPHCGEMRATVNLPSGATSTAAAWITQTRTVLGRTDGRFRS
jgi:hypothetical protein